MAGWSFTHGENANRVLAELLAKILGLIVLHWSTLLHGPALCGSSATRLMRKAAQFARQMSRALGKPQETLSDVLREMLDEMARIKPRPKRRRKPNTKGNRSPEVRKVPKIDASEGRSGVVRANYG